MRKFCANLQKYGLLCQERVRKFRGSCRNLAETFLQRPLPNNPIRESLTVLSGPARPIPFYLHAPRICLCACVNKQVSRLCLSGTSLQSRRGRHATLPLRFTFLPNRSPPKEKGAYVPRAGVPYFFDGSNRALVIRFFLVETNVGASKTLCLKAFQSLKNILD